MRLPFRYGGIYLDQDMMTVRNLFNSSAYREYDNALFGQYTEIIENDAIKKAFLVAQQTECRKQSNCVNNAIMGFPAKDEFLKSAMEETVGGNLIDCFEFVLSPYVNGCRTPSCNFQIRSIFQANSLI